MTSFLIILFSNFLLASSSSVLDSDPDSLPVPDSDPLLLSLLLLLLSLLLRRLLLL